MRGGNAMRFKYICKVVDGSRSDFLVSGSNIVILLAVWENDRFVILKRFDFSPERPV